MKKSIFVAVLLSLVLMSCHHGDSFCVEGTIADASNQYVYLVKTGLMKTEVLDSAYLTSSGAFSMCAPRPEYPELYRLRVNGKSIVLAVDSLETIKVKANWSDVLAAEFENSPKSEQIASLRRSLLDNSLEEHKTFAQQLILKDPASLVAYYALFQEKAGEPVFKIWDKNDKVYYQAVATSWNVWMPENERTKVLYQQVLDQLNSERQALNTAIMQAYIAEQEASTFLEITLPDEDGVKRSLSEMKGKVIILDFCSTEIQQFDSYLTSLYSRYEKYHKAGLEIYQVYPDQSIMVWRNIVKELPWTTVRAEQGLLDKVYGTYNVQTLPTTFIINKKGEIVDRMIGFGTLDAALEEVLY